MTEHTIPLVVHLIYRLDFGGLETLLVDCINHMPEHKYRHAIVCLTNHTAFSEKITRQDVQIVDLNKAPGLGLGTHVALWKLLRQLRPAILHTYNLSAIEYTFTASLAGVPVRIHAEHGRDISDPLGRNRKHNLLRRLMTPFIDTYVAVSNDLHGWLKTSIHVPDTKNRLINNGVDTRRFSPEADSAVTTPWPAECFVIGTVGRLQDIKNQQGLIRAFVLLREALPAHQDKLRLSIIGDGPLLATLKQQVAAAGISDVVWLPGARSDIAAIMRGFNLFALPSLAEGTPVTLLEAMSSGLPVVVSRVGGIPEVVQEGVHGALVAAADDAAFAQAFAEYCQRPAMLRQHGAAASQYVRQKFSITAMVNSYTNLYDALCKNKFKESSKPCVES
ncbi:TIGR03088 family PEP-CTERM/XrtA system glycosyltransferase [Undibacterium sp. Jales W-56]|uniref:TIGR03088 family PEP-CTERM/XrtA system glycosyltransferase n=1 Tax=Undibacterium sp. Jales W-56 TaxID=2897325 RepID=UPI0021D3AEE4|nr:TIGR03088 family PEP-CTERM/XrtA system glycosyltransferase [Undibacterium sp. Jales W-56]MCU6434120.1 TIGR03088 family PEP-CTERM/XrtA system glycosyltransferase [Undibacterium sp. Jales W-56]